MTERQLLRPLICESYKRLFRTAAIFLLPALLYFSYWLPPEQRLLFMVTRLPVWGVCLAGGLLGFSIPIYRTLTLSVLLYLMAGNCQSAREGAPYLVRTIAQTGFVLHGFLEIEQGWTFLLNGILVAFTLQAERYFGLIPNQLLPLPLLFGAAQALTWFRWRALRPLSALLLQQIRLNRRNQQANELLQDCNATLSQRVEERRCELGTALSRLRQAYAELQDLHQQQDDLQIRWLQAQRMDVLASFATGLAHSFSNTITCIWGCLPELKSEDPDAVSDIGEACERAHRICRRMALTGSTGEGLLERLDLNRLLAGTLPLLRRAVDNPIELELFEETAFVSGDSALLDQVIWNLVLNGAQASAPDQPVCIRVSRRADRVLLEVSDRGAGIDSETKERIFEPFFTTRGSRGHGLGLAIVRQATEALRGTVEVHSQPGKGTTFEVNLPQCSTDDAPALQPRTEVPDRSEIRRVLLVEDQEALRRLLSNFLRKHGFEVECCASAEEAGESNPGFDLLVTDVNLPGRNGVELAVQWAAHQPSLAILFISGYPFEASVVPPEVTRWLFLAKPFKLTELLDSLHHLQFWKV